jgi:hypothetical protein
VSAHARVGQIRRRATARRGVLEHAGVRRRPVLEARSHRRPIAPPATDHVTKPRRARSREAYGAGILDYARRQMAVAADHFDQGAAAVVQAMSALERHPDLAETERLRKAGRPNAEALTLAWWIHAGLDSTLNDMAVRDAAACLREDEQRTMRQIIDTEEQDRRRFARRREARVRKGTNACRRRPIARPAEQVLRAGILRAGYGQ